MLASDLAAGAGLSPELNSVLAGWQAAVQKAGTGTGFTVAMDLNAFSLEAPSKILQPFSSPIRNKLARVRPNPVSDVIRWKTITGATPAAAITLAQDGSNAPLVTKTTADVTATMKTIGLGDNIIDEAGAFAEDYENLQATADLIVLNLLMEGEEDLIIGGNITALAAPTNPAGVLGGAGTGSITVGKDYEYQITALTMAGLRASQVAGYTGAGTGESVVSASSAATGAAAANDSVVVTWDDVPGAVAYNVYIQEGGAGGFFWETTVEVNTFTQVNDETPGSAAPGADTSANALAFDGLLPQFVAGSATLTSLDGSALTATTGSKNIDEIVDAMQTEYAANRVGCDEIFCGPAVGRDLFEKVGASTAPAISVNMGAGDTMVTGGLMVDSLQNPFTGQKVPVTVHPTFPAGLVMGVKWTDPYTHSRMGGGSIQMSVVRDYTREILARTIRRTDFQVTAFEVLQVRSVLGSWVLKNVGV